MKKQNFYHLAMAAVVSIALSSCSLLGGGGNTPQFTLSDLQGLWEENDTQHFVRFTTEQSNETGYLYGREWHEDDDVFESDLKPYGDGWFKYKFETTNGGLHELHLMDNGGAEIPKEYIVSKLTSSELSYYEKDRPSVKYYFSKVTETR